MALILIKIGTALAVACGLLGLLGLVSLFYDREDDDEGPNAGGC